MRPSGYHEPRLRSAPQRASRVTSPETDPTAPADDPQAELAALVAATLAHQRRRRALGARAERSAVSVESSSAAALAPASVPTVARSAASTTATPASAPIAPPAPRTITPPPRTPTPAPPAPRTPPPRLQVAASAAATGTPPAPASGDAPARSPEDVRRIAAACGDLASLRAAVSRCEACALARTRTQTVFADGPERAQVLFIGEAPGENEDRQGIPFVGEAGKLLTDIIEKGMGMPRSQVAIANVLKCRPPENRDPSPEETRACTPWLDRQVELVNPKVLIPLGKHASNHVLGLAGPELRSMGSLRERVHERGGRSIVPTFHPSYLLRTPEAKKDCWKDIQLAMGLLGLSPQRRGETRG